MIFGVNRTVLISKLHNIWCSRANHTLDSGGGAILFEIIVAENLVLRTQDVMNVIMLMFYNRTFVTRVYSRRSCEVYNARGLNFCN